MILDPKKMNSSNAHKYLKDEQMYNLTSKNVDNAKPIYLGQDKALRAKFSAMHKTQEALKHLGAGQPYKPTRE